MFVSVILAALLAQSASPAFATPSRDDAAAPFIDAVAASTTRSWAPVFAARGLAYRAPRVVMLRLPVGHPGRGSGYAETVGLVIDADEIERLLSLLGPSASGVPALIIAHEVGHHVQHRLGEAKAPAGARGRELQADCYAGWWLAQARRGEPGSYPIDNPRPRLSAAFQVLDALESGGVILRRERSPSLSHPDFDARVEAISKGLAEDDPGRC